MQNIDKFMFLYVKNKSIDQLMEIFCSDVDLTIKVKVGETLGWRGDPRDLKAFVEIPAGAYDLEGLGRCNLKAFQISKYLVTNSWYEEFVKASGYKNPEYWSAKGIKWLKDTGYGCPEFWDERRWKCPNAPVVGVSWYEASAFCKWLTISNGDGNVYSLPTEQQWQAAAAGFEQREYPWGNENIDPGRCNYWDTKIGKTSPVGIFEAGKTPHGLYDMAGNVLEWCFDWYNKDDRLHRVVRGGSWQLFPGFCQSAFRYFYEPDIRYFYVGFRACVCPVV